eukprot:TRINITY_DN18356_c0_g1_i2.p1 TRINITY_DN18356_c0_g1~~TRINITY_DN18356_c0_g1_i2.p1  ORF type:complete len:419 (+),score=70.79 TRINITY_DN18356_c0_g1_i2:173-1429(+)
MCIRDRSGAYWGTIVSVNQDGSIEVDFSEGIGLKRLGPDEWAGAKLRPKAQNHEEQRLKPGADRSLWSAWATPVRVGKCHKNVVERLVQVLPEEVRRVGLFYTEDSRLHMPMTPDQWESISEMDFQHAIEHSVIGSVAWNGAGSSSEKPERVTDTWDELEDANLAGKCIRLPTGRGATLTELGRVHTEEHVARMMALGQDPTPKELLLAQLQANFVFFGEHTSDCAAAAVGGCLEAVDAVCSGEMESAACLVRPPGHHACPNAAMGFSVYNNVAVAAAHAIDTHGLNRVLILDWDIHHGNGIQDMFWDDPRVLYCSIHRHDQGFFYPGNNPAVGFEAGSPRMVGGPHALGYNVNVGWSTHEMHETEYPGDPEYAQALQNLIEPIAIEYDPELVLVSAGVDSAIGDPCLLYTSPSPRDS